MTAPMFSRTGPHGTGSATTSQSTFTAAYEGRLGDLQSMDRSGLMARDEVARRVDFN